MKIPQTASLHYLIVYFNGYVQFKMPACKMEFIIPPLFVLQVSENDYTADCVYGLEIHVLMEAPGECWSLYYDSTIIIYQLVN